MRANLRSVMAWASLTAPIALLSFAVGQSTVPPAVLTNADITLHSDAEMHNIEATNVHVMARDIQNATVSGNRFYDVDKKPLFNMEDAEAWIKWESKWENK